MRKLLSIVLLLLAGTAVQAQHKPPTVMPFGELKAGLTGHAKTVVRGTEPTTFAFEIVDVLPAEGYAPDLILIKVSGPVIDQVGGIAAGMSGSPLFIDGKIIGAIAFTTAFADTRYGYATGIEDMLKMFQLGAKGPEVARLPVGLRPVATPVLVNGLRGRAYDALGAVLRRAGLNPVMAPAQTPVEPLEPAPAQPGASLVEGSAVAASLTTGDVAITALGTVSYRDGNRLLAFGHPFLQRGQTSLFMHQGYIYGVIPSINLPFKIGAPAGDPVGAFVQDRAAGLQGHLGTQPRSFEVELQVRDDSLRRQREIKLKVIQDPQLAPTLVAVGLLQLLDEVGDRLGGGTVAMRWSVEADGLPRPLTRSDLLYDPTDVVSSALVGPLFSLDALLRNDFAQVAPRLVKISATMSPERKTVRLVKLDVARSTVRPGEVIDAEATLQPYRGERVLRSLKLKVPADAKPGKLLLEAHGRDRVTTGPLSQAAMIASGMEQPATLAELLTALNDVQRGDALTVELLTPEASEARYEALQRLNALPAMQLFNDDPTTLPTLDVELGGAGSRPLAKLVVPLELVVQGRARQVLTVVTGP